MHWNEALSYEAAIGLDVDDTAKHVVGIVWRDTNSVAGRYHMTENLGKHGYNRGVAPDGQGVADGRFNMADYHWIYCLGCCCRGCGVRDEHKGMNVSRGSSSKC